VSAIQPSVLAQTDLLSTNLAAAWELEHDVVVRASEPRDESLPRVSGEGAEATLEVCGRSLVRGCRARIVELGWHLVALRARAPEGSLSSFGVELVSLRAELLGPSLAFWLAPYACRIHHAESFGSAGLFTVSVASTLVDLSRETLELGLGDRLDVYLNRKRQQHAELALIVERLR
jgi:hypothetical protein